VIKMAKKIEPKTVLERTYNVPLRRGFGQAAKNKKAKRAVTTLRKFISRHMKSKDIKIGRHLNMKLWERGIKNPPHHVKVEARKEDTGTVFVDIVGAPKEEVREKRISSRKKRDMSLKDKLQEKLMDAKDTVKPDAAKKARDALDITKPTVKEAPKTDTTPADTTPAKSPELPKKEVKEETPPVNAGEKAEKAVKQEKKVEKPVEKKVEVKPAEK